MFKTINLKKKRLLGLKEIIVTIIAVALTTLGIKASDGYFGNGKDVGTGPCSADMVFITSPTGGFCIDKYEASVGSGCQNSDPANQQDTRINLNYKDCAAVSEVDKQPWRNISQNQAVMACAKAGKRLPTSKEWFQASLGTPDLDSGWQGDDCNVKKNWPDSPGPTGSGKNCVSSSGVYDMIGNVWEWIDGSIIDGKIGDKEMPESGYIAGVDADSFPVKTDRENKDPNYYNDYFWIKKNDVRTIARGGYWDNGEDAGQYAIYAVPDVSYAGPGVGFRCVR
ncbi:formylglycine-generating enzyme family protein [Candidatus Parcubacteria bacterium]|nr:formylglycine-generating enzyme family protein [Patescibacteria group bacterium]MBU4309416.1 formylglycine-generating enzyme family protein [Patescibacteria group bacterium]MBU4432659.1 formylglycine-generating enzyme family protein [Patescibacteria group bacterium]MBU4577777.1 formylglycine-generating enzyme family protein [Patescibacteria group bacterium]MCG2697462.1 formylglycine-generating enzyme family protein [Candidatus Parcubacteria bacterium]